MRPITRDSKVRLARQAHGAGVRYRAPAATAYETAQSYPYT